VKILSAVVLLSTIVATPALAVVLPDASFFQYYKVQPVDYQLGSDEEDNLFAAGSFAYGGARPSTASTFIASDGSQIRALIDMTSNTTTSNARMNYYFQVDGPSLVPVPLAVTLSGRSSAAVGSVNAGGTGDALVYLQGGPTFINQHTVVAGDGTDPSLSVNSPFSQTFYFNVNPGQLNQIFFWALAVGLNNCSCTNDAHGFAEINISPIRFAGPHAGLTLSVSPGIQSAPAVVPEPASWAMLIAGFGLTGAILRRRRQVAA
jgi:hypothetical protein